MRNAVFIAHVNAEIRACVHASQPGTASTVQMPYLTAYLSILASLTISYTQPQPSDLCNPRHYSATVDFLHMRWILKYQISECRGAVEDAVSKFLNIAVSTLDMQ